jgi:hypothetical protein
MKQSSTPAGFQVENVQIFYWQLQRICPDLSPALVSLASKDYCESIADAREGEAIQYPTSKDIVFRNIKEGDPCNGGCINENITVISRK